MNKDKILVLIIEEDEKSLLKNVGDLCEASALEVKNVMFIMIGDENSSVDKINSAANKLKMACKILKIEICPTHFTVYGDFICNSIGDMNENGCLKSFASLVDFSSFKNKKSNQTKLEQCRDKKKSLIKELSL